MSARAEGSAPRALARLYCPPAQQAVFDALLGIEAQIRAGIDRHLEHEVAHTRLGWWREECARLAQGHPVHPLTRTLAQAFTPADGAALTQVAGFVDLGTWDLAGATFETRRELSAYCMRWSAAMIGPLARHALPDTAPERALELGARLHELELLNALGGDARRGRVRLPLQELAAAHVTPEELTRPRWGTALTALARRQHAEARSGLAVALAALSAPEQARLRAVLVWASLARTHSRRFEAALPRASLPGDHHAPLDGWRAWRAARQADAGRLALSA